MEHWAVDLIELLARDGTEIDSFTAEPDWSAGPMGGPVLYNWALDSFLN